MFTLPTHHLATLQTNRTLVLEKVTHLVQNLLATLSEGGFVNHLAYPVVIGGKNEHDAIRLGDFLLQVKQKKLWPDSLIVSQLRGPTTAVLSIEEALGSLMHFTDPGHVGS